MGSKKKPFYRIIATDSRMPRDGRFIETLGYYNPLRTPAEVQVDEEAVFKWIERGAVPSTSAGSLLRREGFLQKWQLMKQGVTGEDLLARVEAIRQQQLAKQEQKDAKKKGAKSAKSLVKEAAAKEAAASEEVKETPAEVPAETAPEPKAEPAADAVEESAAEAPATEEPEKEAAAAETAEETPAESPAKEASEDKKEE